MATLSAELDLKIAEFKKGLDNAQKSVNQFNQKMKRAVGDSLLKGGVFGGLRLVTGLIKGIGRGAFGIARALLIPITAAAIKAGNVARDIIRGAIEQSMQLETYQMRFRVLTGSSNQADKVITNLREDALRTGVAVSAMAENVGKFMAFGFNPKDALQLNKGILDVGGSVGLTTRDMKLLGVALSQVAAKGVANMEELRQQSAEKGIPIFKALEKQLGVTGAELNKMIQEGKVSADEVLDLFKAVPAGEGPFARFAGGAERMATTFQGRIGVMKANYAEFLRMLGAPIIDALKPLLDRAVATIKRLEGLAPKIGDLIAKGLDYVLAVVDTLASMPFDEIINALRDSIKFIGEYMMQTLLAAFTVVSKMVSNTGFWAPIFRVFGQLAQFLGTAILTAIQSALGGNFLEDLVCGKGSRKIDEFLGRLGGSFAKLSDAILGTDIYDDDVWKNLSREQERDMAQINERAKARGDFIKNLKMPVSEDFNIVDEFKEAMKLSPIQAEMSDSLEAIVTDIGTRMWSNYSNRINNRLKDEGGIVEPEMQKKENGEMIPAINSRLSQAINTIAGRSAYAVIAQEAIKANAKQDIANAHLKEIRGGINKLTSMKSMESPQLGKTRFA